MIRATVAGGALILTADNEGRAELADAFREGLRSDGPCGYVRAESVVMEALHEQWEFIAPEEIGALTDAPILADCDGLEWSGDDQGRIVRPDAVVAWFPDYMIRDPWRELANRGRVAFEVAQ